MTIDLTTAVATRRYPTRVDATRLVDRREPVLRAGPAAPGPFSRDELAAFDRDGYVVVPDLFSADEVATLVDALRRIGDSLPAGDERLVREPDSDTVRSLFGFHALPGPLARLARDARLVDRAAQVLGSRVYVHQSRINRKDAFDGRDFGWHSDFETWHAEDGMPAMRALSVTIALTPNEAYNGPLMFIPGSHRVFIACVGRAPEEHHRTSLRKQEYGIPDRATLTALASRDGIEVFTAEPGGVAFFDCNLLHGSAGNISPLPRTSAFLVYNSIDNRLGAPIDGRPPRPEHIASRAPNQPIDPVSGPIGEETIP